VHTAVTVLLPVAAEKSKVPFYIAGGLLATWAVVLSVLLGLRRPTFPGSLGGQRVVIAISATLVAAALSMAVVTSSAPAKSGEGKLAKTPPATGPQGTETPAGGSTPPQPASTPAPAAPGSKKAASRRHGRKQTATTGTPAPPSSPARTAASSIALAASPSAIAYDKKQLSAKAGKVTITFTNPSALEHDVTVAEGSNVLGATPKFIGGSRTLTLTLKAGTYTFYCSVPGHRQSGMEGSLTIT
jgi:plastocyanin